jgi:hypothetical protein
MTRTLPLIAILLAAACNQQDQSSTAAPNAVAEAPKPPAAKAPVPALAGTWNVASVDGKGGTALTLTVGGGTATMAAGCLRRGFTFKQDRNLVAFDSAPSGSANCGSPPSADQEAAFAALDDANTALFGKDGKVTITGYGGTLSLEPR